MKIVPLKISKNSNLSLDESYEVFLTLKQISNNSSFALIFNRNNEPLLVNLEDFNIESDKIPKSWKTTLNGSYVSISPIDSFNADFWDDYFDGLEEAKETFYNEACKIEIV